MNGSLILEQASRVSLPVVLENSSGDLTFALCDGTFAHVIRIGQKWVAMSDVYCNTVRRYREYKSKSRAVSRCEFWNLLALDKLICEGGVSQ